mgnify:CR=1 FL=1
MIFLKLTFQLKRGMLWRKVSENYADLDYLLKGPFRSLRVQRFYEFDLRRNIDIIEEHRPPLLYFHLDETDSEE